MLCVAVVLGMVLLSAPVMSLMSCILLGRMLVPSHGDTCCNAEHVRYHVLVWCRKVITAHVTRPMTQHRPDSVVKSVRLQKSGQPCSQPSATITTSGKPASRVHTTQYLCRVPSCHGLRVQHKPPVSKKNCSTRVTQAYKNTKAAKGSAGSLSER